MPKKKKRKKNYVQKIIPWIIVAIMSYVVASFVLQFMGFTPNDTLTTMYFLFWTVEIVNLMTIKISKVKNKYEHQDEENENEL